MRTEVAINGQRHEAVLLKDFWYCHSTAEERHIALLRRQNRVSRLAEIILPRGGPSASYLGGWRMRSAIS
ncbi:hypothetical protein VTO73DRAFT_7999 [Trametes versicolor]